MTWGILAYLATTPRARRYLSAVSATVSLGVGLTTVYIGTHWLSDVVLGWAAGLLILLALPWFEPLIARTEAWIFAMRERWRERRGGVRPTSVADAGPQPVLLPQSMATDGLTAEAVTAPVEPVLPAGHPTGARARAHTGHPARPGGMPVAPAGVRRPPPHTERGPRGTGSPARPLSGG